MASPSAEKSAKNKGGNKSQNNQNHSRIYNAIFYKGMKEFLKIDAAYYFVTKIINMCKNKKVDSHKRSNTQFLNHGYAN